jgi:hypothetical protein
MIAAAAAGDGIRGKGNGDGALGNGSDDGPRGGVPWNWSGWGIDQA